MYDRFYYKFNYNGQELDRLKDVLSPDFLMAEKNQSTVKEVAKGYGYSTLLRTNFPILLSKVKAAAPTLHKTIESKITLAENFFEKKIEKYTLNRIFANKFKTGTVVSKHKHGSLNNYPMIIFAFYIYSEVDSGNLILHTEEEDIIIRLSPGDLIVHPGYIPHSVNEYTGNNPRLGLIYEYSLKFY